VSFHRQNSPTQWGGAIKALPLSYNYMKKKLTKKQKKEIDKCIKKALKDFGECFRLLAKE
jgi:hypothetical protein